jgi:hypothetical protein
MDLIKSFDTWIKMCCKIKYWKFRYCKKATKFEKISHFTMVWNYLVTSKQSGRFFQIFLAFSQYLNFTIQVAMEQWNQNLFEDSISILYTILISQSFSYFCQEPKSLKISRELWKNLHATLKIFWLHCAWY